LASAALFWIRGTDGGHIQSNKAIVPSPSRSGNSKFSVVRDRQTAQIAGEMQMQWHQPERAVGWRGDSEHWTACLRLW